MSQVRKKIAPPLVGSDIILVIRPGQNSSQVLDCTYSQLIQSLQEYFSSADGLVPDTRTLTINGVTYDLSQDRSWTVSGGGAVDSVNGQTGVVILALDDISNVNAPSPTVGQILQWNGTNWVSATVGAAAWGSIGTGTGVGSQADLVAYLLANYQPLGSYVTTVNGQTGVVSLALDDISNVNATSPTAGQLLQWNGTNWVPATVTGTGTVTNVATGTGLTGGPITNTGTISLNSKLAPADSLAGNALKFLRVNSGETAVEYATVSTGDSISPFLLMGG